MSKQLKYGLLGVVILITLLLVWLLDSDHNAKKSQGSSQVTHISSNWDNQYQWQSKDPYGLFIFNELLKERVPSNASVSISDKKILDSLTRKKEKATYLYLGKEFGMYDDELDSLFQLVEHGSDLIVIAGNVTDNFASGFNPELRFTYDYTTIAQVTYGKESSNLIYLFQQDTLAYPWQMIQHPGNYESSTKVISSIAGRANFISFSYGQGKIMIHSTPECFYNFQLNRKEGFRYAAMVVKEIDSKKPLHYLELGRLNDKEAQKQLEEETEDAGKGQKDDSYLQFLFQTPALRTALLLALIGILLFVIFRSKRMQPLVEVVAPKRNMSEIFVQTIASIYRNKDNPFSVLHLHKKNFYNTVHKHFFIDLSKRTDHREIQHLESRCGVTSEEIEYLLNRLETTDSQTVTEEFLLETIQLKRRFYERTGIIYAKLVKRLDDREIILFRSIWLSFPLLFGGISLILVGTFLLVSSAGMGILLWPIGSFILGWGILRMYRPLVKLRSDEILIYSLFKKKKRYALHAITRANQGQDGLELYLNNQEQFLVKINEMTKSDQQQFNLYLIKHKIIEF